MTEYEKAFEKACKVADVSDGDGGRCYDPLIMFDSGIAHAKAELAQDVVIMWEERINSWWVGTVNGEELTRIDRNGNDFLLTTWSDMRNQRNYPSLALAQAEAVRQVTALKNYLIAALNEKEEGK